MPKRGASEMTHPPPKPRLILARDHAASIAVANECDALRDETEWRARHGVRSLLQISSGLVEATLRPPGLDPRGYGAKASGWRFRVGGEGVGDDPETAAMLGAPPRSPCAARFVSDGTFAMAGVDQEGFVDDHFWMDMEYEYDARGERVASLRVILERAAEWLRGDHLAPPIPPPLRRAWSAASDPPPPGTPPAPGGVPPGPPPPGPPPPPSDPHALPTGGGLFEDEDFEDDEWDDEIERDQRNILAERWREAARGTGEKRQVVDRYCDPANGLHAHAELLGDDAVLMPEWITPPFRTLLNAVRSNDDATVRAAADDVVRAGVVKHVGPEPELEDDDDDVEGRSAPAAAAGVYAFDLFKERFCAMLTEEVDAYEVSGLPKRRPNTMNASGLIVNEIGMWGLMTDVVRAIASPLASALYRDEIFADSLDHHHSFVVHYARDKDTRLDMHHDASEVTLNVCLGRDHFEGAGLRFCGRFGDANHRAGPSFSVPHVPGRAVMHLGRQRHGADVIAAGERMNLIVWARSSAFRAAAAYGHCDPDGYPRAPEVGDPTPECLSEANDHDFERWTKAFAERARGMG
jgi:hypothetical protein